MPELGAALCRRARRGHDAIIVGQAADGCRRPSTVCTRAPTPPILLRILFRPARVSRTSARPRVLPSRALFRATGFITFDRFSGSPDQESELQPAWRHVPALRGRARSTDFDLFRCTTTGPRRQRWVLSLSPATALRAGNCRIFRGCCFFDPDKPTASQQERTARPPLQDPTKIKVDGSP